MSMDELLSLGFSGLGFRLLVFGCPTWDTGLGLLAGVWVDGVGVGLDEPPEVPGQVLQLVHPELHVIL